MQRSKRRKLVAEAPAIVEHLMPELAPRPKLTCWRCTLPFNEAHPFGPAGTCVCVFPIPREGRPPKGRERWVGLATDIIRDVVAMVMSKATVDASATAEPIITENEATT